jgi:hypothetical protein
MQMAVKIVEDVPGMDGKSGPDRENLERMRGLVA